MQPKPEKAKRNKVLIVIFALAVIFFSVRVVRGLNRIAELSDETTGRGDIPGLVDTDTDYEKVVASIRAHKEASSLQGTGPQARRHEAMPIEAPFEGWDQWRPWADWKEAANSQEKLTLSRVDMADPELDFEAFKAQYAKTGDTDRILCLRDIMRFDLTHPKMDEERRSDVRRLFTELASRDRAFIDELASGLARWTKIPGIVPEYFFHYAEILSQIEEAAPKDPKRKIRLRGYLRPFGPTMEKQLSLIENPERKKRLLAEFDKWFSNTPKS